MNNDDEGLPGGQSSRLAVRVGEAARLLDIGRSKAYELIQAGELPAIRVGKSLRVPVRALQRWIEAQANAARKGGTNGTANQP